MAYSVAIDGPAATSLSSMLDKVIDISPPSADLIDLQQTIDESQIDEFLAGEFVKISFRLEIGDLVDSEIMQLYPVSFASSTFSSRNAFIAGYVAKYFFIISSASFLVVPRSCERPNALIP